MPPNNANSRKSSEVVDISLELEDRRPATKCLSKEETSTRCCGKFQSNGIGQSKSQTNVKAGEKRDGEEAAAGGPQRNRSVCSLVDELLCDIYSKMEVKRRTSATTCDLSWHESDYGRQSRNESHCSAYWSSKDVNSLKTEKIRLEKLIAEEGNNLVKHLKRKNFLLLKREAHYDVITAYIQAVSTKRREDTKMKFSLTPGAETGFSQWLDAMKMVAQLPGGMPSEFRTKLWLQLSEKHLNDQNVDWEKAEAVIFNEFTNPDDEELGVQIVKDLHRTGCSLFCGEQEHNQALLKRVLLAYARWNKNVGYCQGFNMLAALILQVMDKDERNAVKVMIYLIEGVLPESYFANNLRGLSVDMAVFRDLLRLRLPKLSKHLEALQHDTNAGASYEPPLTNVFTMQWFLTLFSNCLPQQTVLRVWDLVFLYGNEVLLRTALAIWGILQDRVITVESADEFYSIMGVVTREMLEFGLMDANTLVKMIAMVDPFPNELQELREKYLYNISPWTQSVQSAARKGIRLFYNDPDDQDDTEDEDKIALATAYGVFRRRESTSKELQVSGPTLDISILKQQYAKLRQRQRQAHVIITAACSSNLAGNLTAGPSVSVNHLLMGKSALVNKGRRIGPPEGSIPPPNSKKGEEKEDRKPRIVISGETFHWKDAEKRKANAQSQGKMKSNKKVIQENERNRLKAEEEPGRTKTNHDRTGGVSEKSVEESLRKKDDGSGSSSSSTSTELCDEEFHRYTDLESDDASHSDASGHPGKSVEPFPGSGKLPDDCDKDNLREIKNVAISLVKEIEEKASGKLGEEGGEGRGRESPSPCADRKLDNTIDSLVDAEVVEIPRDNILKQEPEVPRCENVIEVGGAGAGVGVGVGKGEEEMGAEQGERGRWEAGVGRRKSDLGLRVIRENLEMLSKFSQKTSERMQSRSFEFEEKKEGGDGGGGCEEGGKGKEQTLVSAETEMRRGEEGVRGWKNFLVERAISPMAEKAPKAEKVNKEVNTELTFGVEEVEISMRQPRELERAGSKGGGEGRGAVGVAEGTTSRRRSRECIFREKDEIKQRIESSKSDWELKMRKIAELETTTRETLNEMEARSRHRKSFHRSLERKTRRSHLEEEEEEECPETTSLVPKIRLESSSSMEGESSQRKLKISARSFDEITSRTQKLLGKVEESGEGKGRFSPEVEPWRTKDLHEGSYEEEAEMRRRRRMMMMMKKSYEFFSSPTSPEHRTRSNGRYGDFVRGKKYEKEEEEEEEEGKGKGKGGAEVDLDCQSMRGNFNPFPRRSGSRPKELGVKLGLYPTSPETQSKKS